MTEDTDFKLKAVETENVPQSVTSTTMVVDPQMEIRTRRKIDCVVLPLVSLPARITYSWKGILMENESDVSSLLLSMYVFKKLVIAGLLPTVFDRFRPRQAEPELRECFWYD